MVQNKYHAGSTGSEITTAREEEQEALLLINYKTVKDIGMEPIGSNRRPFHKKKSVKKVRSFSKPWHSVPDSKPINGLFYPVKHRALRGKPRLKEYSKFMYSEGQCTNCTANHAARKTAKYYKLGKILYQKHNRSFIHRTCAKAINLSILFGPLIPGHIRAHLRRASRLVNTNHKFSRRKRSRIYSSFRRYLLWIYKHMAYESNHPRSLGQVIFILRKSACTCHRGMKGYNRLIKSIDTNTHINVCINREAGGSLFGTK